MLGDEESLKRDKAWLELEDCTCPYEYKSLGMLYGISMGKTWIRLTTDESCPEHGKQRPDGKL